MSRDICHCIVLRKASRKVSSYYDEALAPLGVNIAQFSLLRTIDRMAPVSLTDLGARVELDRSTVGRNARVLERMGLVAIKPGKDQREAMLTIAEPGRAVLREGAPLWDGVQDAIEARLGPDGARQLRDLLAAL
ncbi:MarR family transcriptional regulator [Shinella sp. S4-D37]|uniref:MarR family winged helix-turn-helix transcriptional regulator n=1 Tax=Shinella sp. S4-D37 TaxID=3161999 RepID=UPI003465134A